MVQDEQIIGYLLQTAEQLHRAGRTADAVAACHRILAKSPRHAGALHQLGVIALQQGDHANAVRHLGAAVAADATKAFYFSNQGVALASMEQHEKAATAFAQALRLDPTLATAAYNLGTCRVAVGDFEKAAQAFEKAIELKPDSGQALNNLGHVYLGLGRLPDALDALEKAHRLLPEDPQIAFNYTAALHIMNRVDPSIPILERIVQSHPTFPQAWRALGFSHQVQGDIEQAVQCYDRAVAAKPDDPSPWDDRLFVSYLDPARDARSILEQHRTWDERFARPLRPAAAAYSNNRDPQRRLRVGLVSPDFRSHPIARFLSPLLKNRDQKRIEIVCYSNVRRPDPVTEEIVALADDWREISRAADDAVAMQVREDRIDILIDLALHTAGNRLLMFARKPAPVQMTFLAYAGTSGMDAIDYRITDAFLDPPGSEDGAYSEKSVRMNRCCWCYSPPDVAPEVNALPAETSGHITFGCFANSWKVSAPTWKTWRKLLANVAHSNLMIYSVEGRHRERLLGEMQSEGIDPGRVRFFGGGVPEEYFRQYLQIDIVLDPFPYNGATTSCDALWMGVPVVTLSGRTAVGRAGSSILHNAGLAELIAPDSDQYIEIAAKLAGDIPRLASMRKELRRRMLGSPLMDAGGYARDFEAVLRRVWIDWCRTSQP